MLANPELAVMLRQNISPGAKSEVHESEKPGIKMVYAGPVKNQTGGRTHLWLELPLTTLQLLGFDCDSPLLHY